MNKNTVQVPFKSKLIKILMVSNLITLFITMASFCYYDYTFTVEQHMQKYELLRTMVKEDTVQALQSGNTDRISQSYNQVASYPGITEVAVFDTNGQSFFSKPQDLNFNLKTYKRANSESTLYVHPILANDKQIGYFVIKPDKSAFYQDIYAIVLLGVVVFCFIITLTFFYSRRLAKGVSAPIHALTETAQTIAHEKDFKMRVPKFSNDEFGVLTDTFNVMLQEIDALEDAHSLQLQVSEDSYQKVKFLLDKTELTKKRLEEEAVQRLCAANRLKKIRVHLDDIINSMPSILVCVDSQLHVKEWNLSARQLTGVSLEQSHNQPLEQSLPIIGEYLSALKESVEKREVKHIEKVRWVQDEQELFFDILIYPLNQEDDLGAVIRLDDVTTHVRMENMMVQTEKMMSVGGLAAGMAHEINNPLGGILQSTQNLIRRIDPKLPKNQQEASELELDLTKMQTYLEKRGILKFIDGIQDSGERAAKIVRNMLQFSRKNDDSFFNNADVNQILSRSIGLAANDYDMKKSYDFRQIDVRKEFADNVPFVPCVSSEVEQVILNLLRNAAQALHEQSDNKAPMIRVATEMDKDYVHIYVEDNGPGMSEEHMSRIFEPFFTTKEVGVGTGLGLSVSYFIIESKHQGQMSVSSEPGVGTRFHIALPLMRAEQTGT